MTTAERIILYTLYIPLLIVHDGWAAKKASDIQENASKAIIGSVSPTDIKDAEKKKPFIIKESISYSYNYDADDKNFMAGLLSEKGKTIRDYTVLVNIHNGGTLNLSSKYQPGTRTLSWGTPYEAALRQSMSAIKHPHEQSALLKTWTGKQLRTYVSFVIIPKGTEMEFKIGYASSQQSSVPGYKKEMRDGGGMQLRLKSLPVGAIVLTEALTEDKEAHERTTFSLIHIFEQAINNFNNAKLGTQLPSSIKDGDLAFKGIEDYLKVSFQTTAQ